MSIAPEQKQHVLSYIIGLGLGHLCDWDSTHTFRESLEYSTKTRQKFISFANIIFLSLLNCELIIVYMVLLLNDANAAK